MEQGEGNDDFIPRHEMTGGQKGQGRGGPGDGDITPGWGWEGKGLSNSGAVIDDMSVGLSGTMAQLTFRALQFVQVVAEVSKRPSFGEETRVGGP